MFKGLSVVHLRKAVGLPTGAGTTAGAMVARGTRENGLSAEARAALDALIAELDRIQLENGGGDGAGG